jgi:hypothetical protein
MRLFPMGCGPSCNRHRDRRFVAIAAAAALVLLGTSSARATMVSFDIDITQSSMAIQQTYDLSELGAGVYPSFPQAAGSDTTRLDGTLLADVTPASIEFMNPSTITFEATGDYAPLDPVTSDPSFPPVGVTMNANYGLMTNAPLFLALVEYGLEASLQVPGARPLLGGFFSFNPGVDALIGTAGRVAYSSVLGSDTGDVIGDPLAAFGTAGVVPGTWDGSVLTLPIQSSFTIALDTGDISPGTHVYVTYAASGQIVATPSAVPEPSTFALLGFGFAGLLAHARRQRLP